MKFPFYGWPLNLKLWKNLDSYGKKKHEIGKKTKNLDI